MAKGTLKVRVIGDAKPMENTLKGLGKKTAAFAASVVAAGAAVGAGLFKVGQTLDDAFDTIRVGTGATGAALDDLKDDFRAVARSVPADMGDVSTAIADLNTRTGLTGGNLQNMASQVLELSRLTGTDLTSAISATTRVIGDFGLSVKDEGAMALDQLFRASQATGIGVDQLADQMVQFGAPLRQLGFDFDESAALIAKFEKEGVNAEAVLGGMKQSLGKMAKAGEEPIDTFARLSAEIANAGSTGEANAIAVEAFGTRAGPDLAAAIREGRFELTDLVGVIEDGTDTIMGASEETRDFSETFQEFKNQALLAIEPIATRVFALVGDFAETHGPKVSAFITDTLVPSFEDFIARMQEIVDVWGPRVAAAFDFIRRNGEVLIPIIAAVAAGFMTYKAIVAVITAVTAAQAALNVVMSMNPIGLVIVAIAALTAGLVVAYKKSETFRNIVDGAFRAVAAGAQWLTDKFRTSMNAIKRFIDAVVRRIQSMVSAARGAADTVAGVLSKIPTPGNIRRGVGNLIGKIPGFDDGGVVPGPVGSPQLILAHGGETVLPTHKSGGGGGTVVNIYGDTREIDADRLNTLLRRAEILAGVA